jgi:DivIVA domain-containing protein
MLADEVREARFGSTKFRRGWDQDEVDDYLDRIIETLRQHEAASA